MGKAKDFFKSLFGKVPEAVEYVGPVMEGEFTVKGAYYEYPILRKNWDGEKNKGELGSAMDYCPDYHVLRARSWEAYTDNDIAKILVNTMVDWVIGPGLMLQAEPVEEIINDEGFNFDVNKFTTQVEKRFRLHAKHNNSSYSRNDNLHNCARKAMKGMLVGGDLLAVFRYDKGVNVQLIDGAYIGDPLERAEADRALARGNEIIHGVERNRATHEHIAFHVQQRDGTSKRILARGRKTGRLQAVMIYADEFRVDNVRGMPLYAASLEKMKKMDRYVEAMVSGAEERAKVPYFYFKNHFSDDEPIQKRQMDAAANGEDPNTRQPHAQMDVTEAGKQIRETTAKEAIELPIGVDLKSIESTMELRLKEFTETNFIFICASVSIPYEVALMKYENSFSASRMASQSFQHIINTRREYFSNKFYKTAYDIELEVSILTGKVQANGYVSSMVNDDYLVQESYHNARFVGANVPQADPSKEVKASLLKIAGYLSTIEEETEVVGTGDFYTNMNKLSKEYEKIKEVIPFEFMSAPNAETSSAEFQEEPKAGSKTE